MTHILIIGAGLIGAGLAHHLTRQGAKVTLLETGLQPAAQASGRSFGWINANYALNEAHHHLRVAGMAAHHRLAVELGAERAQALWQWPGCIWWEEEAGLEEMAAEMERLSYPVQLLSQAQIAAREPRLVAPPRQALFFPSEGVTDPAALARALLEEAAAGGARLIFGLGALQLLTRNGMVCGARTAVGDFEADQVILAAGTGAAALLAGVGFDLPMLQRPGLILTTRPQPPVLNHVLALPGQDLRQDPSGRFIAPLAARHQSDDGEVLPDHPQPMLAEALTRLNGLFHEVSLQAEHLALAYRPVPGDGLPVVGEVQPGLWLAVLHSGVTLGAFVAETLAAEVLGQSQDPLLATFRPARFRA